VTFRAPENVLATIQDAVKAGIDCLHLCFDPQPDRKYYLELFRLVRRRKIDISLVFECWSLPTREFIDAFKKTFGKGRHSQIVLSPETASERLRKLNKGFFYTNSGLLDALGYLKKKGIFTAVYFTYPLPYETPGDVNATVKFIKLIKNQLGDSGMVSTQGFDLDPASPIFLEPAKYRITRKTRSFAGYCKVKKGQKFLGQKSSGTYKKWLGLAKVDTLLAQGYDFFHRRLYAQAISEFKDAEKLSREDPRVNFSLASCYRNIGRLEEANQELGKAVLKFKRIQPSGIYSL
jgi:tetratricopeptide (TPR) repeat protein